MRYCYRVYLLDCKVACRPVRYDVINEVNFKLFPTVDKIFFFHILMFAKPECDNVLQPELRSSEDWITLSHADLAKVNIRKRMLYCHCYIPS